MLKRLTLLMVAAAFALGACASGPKVQITSVHDDKADFGAMKTYSFSKPLYSEEADVPAEINDILRDAARVEMEKRGYTFVEDGGDIRVDFFVWVDSREEVKPVTEEFGFEGAQPVCMETAIANPPPPCDTKLDYKRYQKGTLAILAVDNGDNHLLWEGVASGVMRPPEERPQGEELRERLMALVSDVYETYPR